MNSYFWLDTVNLGWSIVCIQDLQVIVSKQNCFFFLFLKTVFVLANSVDADEMPHHAAFHLGLHCLPMYAFRSHYYTKN